MLTFVAVNLEAKVVGFLVVNEGRDFCDACLAAKFGIAPRGVGAIIAAVRRRSPIVLRDRWSCELCGKQGEVSRALGGHTIATKGKLRRRASRAA